MRRPVTAVGSVGRGTGRHTHATRSTKSGTPKVASATLTERRARHGGSASCVMLIALIVVAGIGVIAGVVATRSWPKRLRQDAESSRLAASQQEGKYTDNEHHKERVLPYFDLDWRAEHAVVALSRAAFHRELRAQADGHATREGRCDAASSEVADDLIAIVPHLYPPLQRRERAAHELRGLLNLGPRVAGTSREGVLAYILRAGGLGQSGRCATRPSAVDAAAPHLSREGRALLAEAHVAASALASPYRMADDEANVTCAGQSWWSLSWDNFTLGVRRPAVTKEEEEEEAAAAAVEEKGGSQGEARGRVRAASAASALRPTRFSNVIFHFAGGARFRARRGRAARGSARGALDARSARPLRAQALEHVVLAAHWDSKKMPNFTFLAAMDSAVAVLQLTRLMRSIAAWSDVAAVLRGASYAQANATDADAFARRPAAAVREQLARLLSPLHYALLYRYAFAEARGEQGAEAGANDVRAWLDAVEHLPAITILLFDGEEAFGEWRGEAHTYGSRHLARRWRATPVRDPAAPPRRRSLFDSVDLFALLDLVGPAGTQFLNTMPPQSGVFYRALSLLERAARGAGLAETLRLSRALAQRANASPACPASAYEALPREAASGGAPCAAVPTLWLRYGAPAEMFTLHGVARTLQRQTGTTTVDYRTRRSYAEALWRSATLRDDAAALAGLLAEHNRRNVFFPVEEGQHGPRPAVRVSVEDDQLHWLDTRRVLHLIPIPFPPCWHEACDDGGNIDHGTVVDLDALWLSFVMRLGEFWRHNATQP